MSQCVNLREAEDGSLEDSILFESITPEEMIHFDFEGRRFCYNTLTLLRYIGGRDDNTVPERFVLNEEQVEHLYLTARSLFPSVYVLTDGSEALPFIFKTLENAITVASEKGYKVYKVAETDDPSLAQLLYPNGFDEAPVFAVRPSAAAFRRNNSPPGWAFDENGLRDEVFERDYVNNPLPVLPPPPPRLERRRPVSRFAADREDHEMLPPPALRQPRQPVQRRLFQQNSPPPSPPRPPINQYVWFMLPGEDIIAKTNGLSWSCKTVRGEDMACPNNLLSYPFTADRHPSFPFYAQRRLQF